MGQIAPSRARVADPMCHPGHDTREAGVVGGVRQSVGVPRRRPWSEDQVCPTGSGPPGSSGAGSSPDVAAFLPLAAVGNWMAWRLLAGERR